MYLRGPGILELGREVDRANRTGQPLVVAFVDVDGLKAINDIQGHAAGDRMLHAVAQTLRTHVRSYDLVIRYGGDEFVCALAGLDVDLATERLAIVKVALAEGPEHGSITIGIAKLEPSESLDEVTARADAALYAERERVRGPRRGR